jgi:hypothetical protein
METASFTGFFKVLLYFFAFYYVFKFLARLFLPVLAKKVVEKASQQFQEQQQKTTDQYSNTTNQSATSEKPKEKKKVGEYVDFEEIE